MTIPNDTDKAIIDGVISQFFRVFHNKTAAPDWQLLYSICIPETLILKKEGAGHATYNLESFIEPRRTILSDGTLTDFEESETAEQTLIVNNIAQRYSKYEKCGCLRGNYFSGTGTKFFQLVRTPQHWKITAIIWEDDIL